MNTKYMLVVMGLGVFMGADMCAMQDLQKGSQENNGASLASAYVASPQHMDAVEPDPRVFVSPYNQTYDLSSGKEACGSLKKLFDEVSDHASMLRSHSHSKKVEGTVLEDEVRWWVKGCKERATLVADYQERQAKGACILALKAQLIAGDTKLLRASPYLVKKWSQFREVSSYREGSDWGGE